MLDLLSFDYKQNQKEAYATWMILAESSLEV